MIVGRLAPSPTGLLHLGHARSFLLAWWQVRASAGRILLRLEDLDRARSRTELADATLRDLEWLGIDWDGAIVRQSQRAELYRGALARLQRDERLYPCVCTRRELDLALGAPHESDGTRPYPGTCRGRFASEPEARESSSRSPALRLRVPAGRTEFHDELRGPQSFDVAQEVGDFPVWTREGVPAYQLAVVVDDAEQGVDTVLRGDDLLSSTARQRLLQSHLGLPSPRWFHVPLVVDAAGRRLAKRADDLSLARLRAGGVDARSVVAWAARACGMEVGPLASAGEALAAFDLSRLPRSPVRLHADPLAGLRAGG